VVITFASAPLASLTKSRLQSDGSRIQSAILIYGEERKEADEEERDIE
jgi:hypothetical protein